MLTTFIAEHSGGGGGGGDLWVVKEYMLWLLLPLYQAHQTHVTNIKNTCREID